MEPKINPDMIAFAKIIDDMYNLYVQKNNNYGNSFSGSYKDYGSIAGLIPLRYKFDRIANLMQGGENNFESLRDNLIDLANYAIMNVIELDKKQNKVSIADTAEKKPETKKQILNEQVMIDPNDPNEINLEAKYDEYNGEDGDTVFSEAFLKRGDYR